MGGKFGGFGSEMGLGGGGMGGIGSMGGIGGGGMGGMGDNFMGGFRWIKSKQNNNLSSFSRIYGLSSSFYSSRQNTKKTAFYFLFPCFHQTNKHGNINNKNNYSSVCALVTIEFHIFLYLEKK